MGQNSRTYSRMSKLSKLGFHKAFHTPINCTVCPRNLDPFYKVIPYKILGHTLFVKKFPKKDEE